jgi:hypothetical protein
MEGLLFFRQNAFLLAGGTGGRIAGRYYTARKGMAGAAFQRGEALRRPCPLFGG